MRFVYGLMVFYALGCTGDGSPPAQKSGIATSPALEHPATTARSERFVMTRQNTQPAATARGARFRLDSSSQTSRGTSRNALFIMDAWVGP